MNLTHGGKCPRKDGERLPDYRVLHLRKPQMGLQVLTVPTTAQLHCYVF